MIHFVSGLLLVGLGISELRLPIENPAKEVARYEKTMRVPSFDTKFVVPPDFRDVVEETLRSHRYGGMTPYMQALILLKIGIGESDDMDDLLEDLAEDMNDQENKGKKQEFEVAIRKLKVLRIMHAIRLQKLVEDTWHKHKKEIPEKDRNWPNELREQHIQRGLLPTSWPLGGKP